MKAIKLLFFAVLFVAGQQAIAQDIYVNNNMTVQVDITFNFDAPCGKTVVNAPATSTTFTPYTTGCNLNSIVVTFIDNSCTPPVIVTIPVTITSNPIMFTYTSCAGTIFNFDLNFTGTDYTLEIF